MPQPLSPAAGSPPPLAWRAGAAVALVCLALGIVSAAERHHVSVTHGDHLHMHQVFGATMPGWIVLAMTLPLVLVLAAARPMRPLRARTLLIHAGLFAGISVLHAFAVAWSQQFIFPAADHFTWAQRFARGWLGTFPIVLTTYASVLLTAWAMHEAREREQRATRASQLEAQLQSVRLAALRAKLQPHFLYNTLHGIAALVQDVRTARALAAIEQLSELLHASLRDDDREEITVRDELELADRYLALQKMRFGDRLTYDIDVAVDAADALVPVLLLQPIVENAVVHGLDAATGKLHVVVRAACDAAGTLRISIENDGPAVTVRDGGTGVGLAATRARLAAAYGGAATFVLVTPQRGGVIVQIEIPHAAHAGSVGAA